MRIVIQGDAIRTPHLAAITQQLPRYRGEQFVQIAEHAYYLPGQREPVPEILRFCAAEGFDCAFVDDRHTLSHIGLAVMDMDSTLINIECIDEIADMHGLKPQVAQITQRAMRGEIEFAESLRQRVRLLAGLGADALQRVVDERLQLSPGARDWVDRCRAHGIRTLLVSGGFDFFAERARALAGIDRAYANTLEIIDGRLTGAVLGEIIDAQAKADLLEHCRHQPLMATGKLAVAVGDGANDLKMMAAADIGVAYHAKPVVQAQADYVLNHVGLDGLIHLFTI